MKIKYVYITSCELFPFGNEHCFVVVIRSITFSILETLTQHWHDTVGLHVE